MKLDLTLEPPPTCKTCGKDFAENETRVMIVRNAVPADKWFQTTDGEWGHIVEDGMPLYTVEAHHEGCAPPREAVGE